MSKRLLIIGPIPPPNGGMARQAKELLQMMENSEWSVEFIAVNFPLKPSWLDRLKGVRAVIRLIVYCFSLLYRIHKNDVVHLMSNSGWSWHLFSSPVLVIGKLKGAKVIVNYRGGEAETFLKAQSSWILPFMNMAKQVVVPSGFLAEVFAKWDIHTVVVPNILDTEFFKRDSDINKRKIIAVVRNLEEIYGVDIAIQAFAKFFAHHPDYELHIAGDGVEKSKLKALCQAQEITSAVKFLGRIEKQQVKELLNMSEIFLNSSRQDNSPNSLLEAMSIQTPVVTTNAGGIPFIVRHGVNASVCSVDDTECLSQALIQLVGSKDTQQQYLAEAAKTIHKYEKRSVKEAWLNQYEAVA